ncbi:threonine-phosphate decarboxylase CobD [Rhizobium helianthi]|uniref:threonine-phosphate decarboxylase n=2 Tax=Rhizobium helianthi TaxID=1132695 RepID=A0ABW4M529_9HYPH
MDKLEGNTIEHGGSLSRAALAFTDAPQPWIDLSTGVNPHSYAYSPVPATAFSRLPDPSELRDLCAIAARAYGAKSGDHVAAAPGTHLFLPMLVESVFSGRDRSSLTAAILSPTYAEHAKTARMLGFQTVEASDPDALEAADLAVVVNPNNPDGRMIADERLLALSHSLAKKGGLLLVDEAFRDVMDEPSSLVAQVHPGLAVLRSFGKFFGLAGIRLGFAVASPDHAQHVRHLLGPWAIPGPTLHIGRQALADQVWQKNMRLRLRQEAERLDGLLAQADLPVVSGTTLFRYARHEQASEIHQVLGKAGILVRRFSERPQFLRFGLPSEGEWERLGAVLCSKNWQS